MTGRIGDNGRRRGFGGDVGDDREGPETRLGTTNRRPNEMLGLTGVLDLLTAGVAGVANRGSGATGRAVSSCATN